MTIPFSKWSSKDLLTRLDEVCESALNTPSHLLPDLVDESTAIAAILSRRKGVQIFCVAQSDPPDLSGPFAEWADIRSDVRRPQ